MRQTRHLGRPHDLEALMRDVWSALGCASEQAGVAVGGRLPHSWAYSTRPPRLHTVQGDHRISHRPPLITTRARARASALGLVVVHIALPAPVLCTAAA